MARKIACGFSKLICGGPAEPADFEATVIPLLVPLAKKRQSEFLKDCEVTQKYNIKGQNEPWQLLLILIPVCML